MASMAEKKLSNEEFEHDGSSNGVGEGVATVGYSKAEERRLLRKIDLKLIPFLSLLYLLSFLDRVNIGQARLNGLEADLHMKGNMYSIASLVFFVSYVAFEIPSNLALKYLRPTRWIPLIMILWGITMTCMGLVRTWGQLVAVRFLLGLTESGLFPGICYYLTLWYARREQNFRISLFFSSATVSGAFGGLLAYGISHMKGLGGYAGWSWIFIIEGLLTFVVACAAPFLMADFPEEATFLTPDDKEEVIRRLKVDQGAAGASEFSWAQARAGFTDWRTYVYALIYIGVAEPLYSLALFVPTIISKLGKFTLPQSQLLSTPPYVVAFIITLISALYSDRIGNRGYFNVFWMSIVAIGFIILLSIDPVHSPGVAYFAVFLCVGAVAPCISNTITWCGNNIGAATKRAAAMGLFFSTGNAGGIPASLVYFTTDAPRFRRGHAVGLGFAVMAIVLSLFMTIHLKRENARRDAKYGTAGSFQEASTGDVGLQAKNEAQLKIWGLEGATEKEILLLGDRHPGFRYIP